MSEIFDVVTRLSFQLSGQGLDESIKKLEQQANVIESLKRKYADLERYYNSSENVQQQQKTKAAMDATTKAIDAQTDSLKRNFNGNKEIQAAIKEEVGLLQQLSQFTRQAAKERETLTNPKAIKAYTDEIKRANLEASNLMAFGQRRVSDNSQAGLQNRIGQLRQNLLPLSADTDLKKITQINVRIAELESRLKNLNNTGKPNPTLQAIQNQAPKTLAELQKIQTQLANITAARGASVLPRILTGNLGSALNSPQAGQSSSGAGFIGGALAGAGFAAFTMATQKVKEFITSSTEMGEKLEGITRAFSQLNRPDLLGNLREATRGTISDLKLMQKAVQADQFQIPLDKLGGLLEFARNQAIKLGRDVDDFTDRVILGIAYQSTRRLDDLGLSQKLVREEFKKTGDFAEAAMNLIEKKNKNASGGALLLAESQQKYNAQLENTQALLGKLIAEYKLAVAAGFRDLFTGNPLGSEGSRLTEFANSRRDANEEAEIEKGISARVNADYVAMYKSRVDEINKMDYLQARKSVETLKQELDQKIKLYEKFGGKAGAITVAVQSRLQAEISRNVTASLVERIASEKDPVTTIKNAELNRDELSALQEKLTTNRNPLTAKDTDEIKKISDALIEVDKQIGIIDAREAKRDANNTKRTDHYLDLQKQILEQERKLAQTINDTGIQAEDSIIDAGSINYLSRIERLNEIEDEYRRRGELTEKNIFQFQKLRELADSLNDAEVANALRTLFQKQTDVQNEFYLQSLEQQKDFAEGRLNALQNSEDDTFEARKDSLDKRFAFEDAQLSKKYADDVKKAAENEQDISKVNEYYFREREAQKNKQHAESIQSEIEYFEEQISLINKYGDYEINENAARAAKIAEAINNSFISGGIGSASMTRKLARLEYKTFLENLATEADTASDALQKAKAAYDQLVATGATAAQLSAARNNVNVAQARSTSANQAVANVPTQSVFGNIFAGAPKEGETAEDYRIRKIEGVKDAYESLVDTAIKAYSMITDASNKQLAIESSAQEKKLSYAQKLAERGNTEQLRIETERQDAITKKQKEAAREQIQINAILATSAAAIAAAQALQGVANAAATGDPYTIALRVAAAVAAIVGGFAAVKSATQGFEEGGYTGDGRRNDETAGVVHKNEFVMNAENTRKYRNVLEAMHEGRFEPTVAIAGIPYTSKSLEKKLDILTETVANQQIKVNQVMDRYGLTQTVEQTKRHANNAWR